MQVQALSPSSIEVLDRCPHKFFIEQVIKHRGPSIKAGIKGTTCHSVFEILAQSRKAHQEGNDTYVDEIVGEVKYGTWDIDDLVKKCYEHHTTTEGKEFKWTKADFNDVKKWVYSGLEFNKGEFDPRNMTVFATEQFFEEEIIQPWAAYKYQTHDGQTIEGFLKLRGIIDLVEIYSADTLHILDWKSGKMEKFHTGQAITYESLQKDIQLLTYHYFAKKRWTQFKHVAVTIFYIKFGKPFTIPFSDQSCEEVLEIIKEKFLLLKEMTVPHLNKSELWRCKQFCDYSKTSFEGTNIKPLIEFRDGKFSDKGSHMSKCCQTQYAIERKGIEWVTQFYKKK